MYTCYLLDWDGCLANTLSVWSDAYLAVYENYGIKTTIEEVVEKSWGNWEKGPSNFGLKNPTKVIDEVISKANRGLKKVPFHEGVREVLEELHSKNRQLAIISSSPKDTLYAAISNLNAAPLFDGIISKEDVLKPKPDPEGIKIALGRFGVEEDDAVMVGDSEKDILAGKSAGVSTVLFYPRINELFYQLSDLGKTKPDFVIRDFSELLIVSS